ncbi:MAG: hypothetical protein ACOCY9_02885 [Desulfohalobiaceae bacterium]
MYRFFLVCFLSIFLLAACQVPREQDSGPFQEGSPRNYQHSTQVRVSIHPEEISAGGSPEELLWSRAEHVGMTQIMNHWLSQRLLLRPVKDGSLPEGGSFLQRNGELSASQDEQTGIYTQEFVLESTLTAIEQASGRIVNLEDQHSIGGQFQHLIIQLSDAAPDEKGAYFMVATKSQDKGPGTHQLLGGGRIHHVLENTAQGVLMETRQEVRPGDMVFLLQSSVQPVAAKQEERQERTRLPEQEEVLVEPKSLDKEPEAKGSK